MGIDATSEGWETAPPYKLLIAAGNGQFWSRKQGGSAKSIFSLLFGWQTEGKYLAVEYQGFIDDSADRNRERVVISAVIISEYKNWRYLTKYWNKRLREDGIEYFKSTHCRQLRGEFSKFTSEQDYPKPLGREAANAVRDDLEKIVKKAKLTSLGIVVPIPIYKKMKEETRYASILPTDPYYWAVQTVWRETAEMMRGLQAELRTTNTVSFGHDDGSNFHVLHDLYLEYKKQYLTDARILRDFVPLDDKTNPTIQAADVVADVTFRYAEEWAINPTPANLTRLRGTIYKIVIWDEEYARAGLESVIKRQEAKNV